MVRKTGIVEAPRHGGLPAGDGLSGERAGGYLPDHSFGRLVADSTPQAHKHVGLPAVEA
jgi:hypothetical protein